MIKIFLITDNKNEISKRLKKRNQNTDKKLVEEIKHYRGRYKTLERINDYIVINKDLESCFETDRKYYF